jgi:hypothetical protein
MRIGYGTCQRILTADQKQQRVTICKLLRQIASTMQPSCPGLSLVTSCDPETMQQSSQWKSPNSSRPKKARQVKSKVKSMLIIFIDITKKSSWQAKQSIPHTTVKFYGDCLKMCEVT